MEDSDSPESPSELPLVVSLATVTTQNHEGSTVTFFIEKFNEKAYAHNMTELESRIVNDLSSGNFEFTAHAVQRSNLRQVTRADIQKAAQDWVDVWTEDQGEIVHVIGPDLNEEEIEICAADDGGTVVITVVDAS